VRTTSVAVTPSRGAPERRSPTTGGSASTWAGRACPLGLDTPDAPAEYAEAFTMVVCESVPTNVSR